MRAQGQRPGSFVRGVVSPGALAGLCACLLAVTSTAAADDRRPTATIPDPPRPTGAAALGPVRFRPSWDLDGLYLWLGPTAAASHIDATWDSTVGGHLAVIRVHERDRLGALGGAFGATLWTERPGGRLWLDAMLGTRIGGRMVGASIGPLVELGSLSHPRPGGSIGLWAFLGVTPFARVGVVDELGTFAEIGLHIALPALRW